MQISPTLSSFSAKLLHYEVTSLRKQLLSCTRVSGTGTSLIFYILLTNERFRAMI